jgi:hypothetical protein
MILSIPITLDLQDAYPRTINLSQNEMAGRRLAFTIVSGSVPVDLTGKTVLLFGKKPDGTGITLQLTLTAPTLGQGYCDITSQVVSSAGNVDLQIRIFTPAATGSATSGTSTSMYDTSKTWTVNAHAGKWLYISSGAGAGQSRLIVSNTATQLVASEAWDVNPAAGSAYSIISEVGNSFVFVGDVKPSVGIDSAVLSSNEFSALIAALATTEGLAARIAALEAELVIPAWIDVSTTGSLRLLGTWTGHVWYKKVGNRVYVFLDALINANAVGSQVYNMPAGYRPGKPVIKNFIGQTALASPCRSVVTTAGDLYIQNPAGGPNAATESYNQYFDYLAEG